MRTESIDKQAYRSFWARAEEFLQAMKILLDLQERFHAAALLGIHAVIAMNDALTVSTLGQRCRSESHADAKQLLKEACARHGITEIKGVTYLSDVIGLKSEIAYGKRFSPAQLKEAQKIHDRTLKFFAWAYVHFDVLNTERSESDETRA